MSNKEVKLFRTLYENFKDSWKKILEFSERFERFNFSFECNAEVQFEKLTEEEIDNDEIYLKHVIINLNYPEFKMTGMTLIALATFQNKFIDHYGQEFDEQPPIYLSDLESRQLIQQEPELLPELASAKGYCDPNYHRQMKIIYDFKGLQHSLKADVFKNARRIFAMESDLEQYVFVDEKMNINEKLEKLAEMFPKTKRIAKERGKDLKKLLEYMDKGLEKKRKIYKDLRKVISLVTDEYLQDKKKTISDIREVRSNMMVSSFLLPFKLSEILHVFEKIEFPLSKMIIADNVPEVFKVPLMSTNYEKLRKEIKAEKISKEEKNKKIKKLKNIHKKEKNVTQKFKDIKKPKRLNGAFSLVQKCVLRNLESCDMGIAEMNIDEFLTYNYEDKLKKLKKKYKKGDLKKFFKRLGSFKVAKLVSFYTVMYDFIKKKRSDD